MISVADLRESAHKPCEDDHLLLDNAELDRRIAALIRDAKLTKDTNGFFIKARSTRAVSPVQAVYIAHNWREITKAFMFSTISGLGAMAEQAYRAETPDQGLLRTIQTVHGVIGDDLSNYMPVFKKVAPKGVEGIHYIWWHDSVIQPILECCGQDGLPARPVTSLNALRLIAGMEQLSRTTIGTAVQLRVVEAIALEIAVAFRRVFARVVVDGRKVFPKRDDLAWMNAHIKAEVVHNQQVSDHDTGMTAFAVTVTQQEEMLRQTADYVDRWSRALSDFEYALSAMQ
jgi:uncharacterized protein DUF6202